MPQKDWDDLLVTFSELQQFTKKKLNNELTFASKKIILLV